MGEIRTRRVSCFSHESTEVELSSTDTAVGGQAILRIVYDERGGKRVQDCMSTVSHVTHY